VGKRKTEPSLRYDIGRGYNSATPGLPRFRPVGGSGFPMTTRLLQPLGYNQKRAVFRG
jgi:hypothetical protein